MPSYLKSSSEIQQELLNNISDSYEKSKGYFLWDILKSIAIVIKNLLIYLQEVSNKLDIENLEGDELERFIYQRTGLKRKAATYAAGQLYVKGNGTIKEGDFFETEGLIRFTSVETKEIVTEGYINIRAVKAGVIGNVAANTVTKIPITIAGITGCNNTAAITEGYEAEEDIELRERYYEKLRTPATSGNKYHYIQWAKEVEGVGGARCVPLWNGNNTVKVIIIDSDKQPASEELVHKVQTYIDPESTGKGEGEAPVGAYCTVVSAEPKVLNISASIQLLAGYSVEAVTEFVKNNIVKHLQENAFKQNYVSYAKLGALILETEGVKDYKDLKIGSEELTTSNLECEEAEVIVIGSVDLSEF